MTPALLNNNDDVTFDTYSLSRIHEKESGISGSLWLSKHLLLDEEEWRTFFSTPDILNMEMFRASGLFNANMLQITPSEFTAHWKDYLHDLYTASRVDDARFRQHFSAYLSLTRDALRVKVHSTEKGMIIPVLPCVTMQLHRFSCSKESPGKVLSGVFGPHTISWGVTISYPQIAQNQGTKKIMKALSDESCHNRILWKSIQRFVREHTLPLPLILGEKKIWASIRIGRNMIRTIRDHQELNRSSFLKVDFDALSKIPKSV